MPEPTSVAAPDLSTQTSSSSSAPFYKVGAPVWVAHAEDGYTPGTITTVPEATTPEGGTPEGGKPEGGKGGPLVVQISSGGSKEILDAETEIRDRPDGEFLTADDCTSLTHLDDANILENLRARYLAGSIYTFTASVLLAVNPYSDVSHLYTKDIKRKYVNIGSAHTLPPHPYSLADMAYRQLQQHGNQALVISGESGAGKTETAKIVMSCLADRSRTGESQASDIQNKILNGANPILESIGNATTVRNGNSSRFGKYNALCFNAVGNLVGAEVRTYLLESSRVVLFGDGERTYHVFYEMLWGYPQLQPKDADEFGDPKAAFAELGLDPERRYKLLYGSITNDADAKLPQFRKDPENFQILDTGLADIGFSAKERRELYAAYAGIIHLGDVQFITVADKEGQDVSAIEPSTENCLEQGAKLCGFDATKLRDVFLKRAMVIKRKEQGVEKTEHYTVPRSAEQAAATQQSLLKMLYKRLFHLICEQINKSVHGGESQKRAKHIGILDIYGFECLQVNSFEQVCINLANERLQQFFVEKVLTAEQVLYAKEGLPWEDVTLPDAGPVLNCVSSVFATLDDHNMRLTRNQPTTDQKFTEECHRKLGLAGIFREPKRGKNVSKAQSLRMSDGFVIAHYAGEVTYTTKGFLEKNNAKLVGDAECLIRDAQDNGMIQKCTDLSACQLGQSSFTSVARKYLRDLDLLMDTLASCNLHYIRCFKPNVQQKPKQWNGGVMLEQMKQSGTVELVKIMHDGYPHRCVFQDLAERFQPIMPAEFRDLDPRSFVEVMMIAFSDELKRKHWTLGTTRLFLKAGKLAVLEKMTGEDIGEELVAKLRKHIRRQKLQRCFTTVKICLYLPKVMRRTRNDNLRFALVRCCRVYVRLMRWYRIIRVRRSKDRMCLLLHRVIPLFVTVTKWVKIARKRVKGKHQFEKTIQKSVFLMWQDLASEERLAREEQARLEADQKRKDEELERAYQEMLARRNKDGGATESSGTADGAGKTDSGTESGATTRCPSSSSSPNEESATVPQTPPLTKTDGAKDGEDSTPPMPKQAPAPPPIDASILAELEKLRRENAALKQEQDRLMTPRDARFNPPGRAGVPKINLGGAPGTPPDSRAPTSLGLGLTSNGPGNNKPKAMNTRRGPSIIMPALDLSKIGNKQSAGAKMAPLGGIGGLPATIQSARLADDHIVGGATSSSTDPPTATDGTTTATSGAGTTPSTTAGTTTGGTASGTSAGAPTLGANVGRVGAGAHARRHTQSMLTQHAERKNMLYKQRQNFELQRKLLEEDCGFEDVFSGSLTARGGGGMTARGGMTGRGAGGACAGDADPPPSARVELGGMLTGGPCPTPRQQSIHRKDNQFQTPGRARIDAESMLNTPTINSARRPSIGGGR
ncbi:unnamed protein product [Amoebophrya sp. A25]|nr:unnamed protein product [Amoebophrya sp. A25]|eukprot:GSA25T00023190001.1